MLQLTAEAPFAFVCIDHYDKLLNNLIKRKALESNCTLLMVQELLKVKDEMIYELSHCVLGI